MKLISLLEILVGAGIIHFANNKAATFLGYIVIFIGLSYLIWNEEIQFKIDNEKNIINWRKKNIFRTKKKLVAFSDVKRVFVQQVGKVSTFTEFYCISLELKSGEIINAGDRYSSAVEAQTKADLLTTTLIHDK